MVIFIFFLLCFFFFIEAKKKKNDELSILDRIHNRRFIEKRFGIFKFIFCLFIVYVHWYSPEHDNQRWATGENYRVKTLESTVEFDRFVCLL